MRVFVTGATGFIGSAVVRELIEAGHKVTGLARSEAAAKSLIAMGAKPHRGTVEDLESLRRGAAAADGAVHTAFFHAFSHANLSTRLGVMFGGSPRGIVHRFIMAAVETDRRAIESLGAALSGPDRPLVAAFGTMALTAGKLATEEDAPDIHSVGGARGETEKTMLELASRGVRTSIVRLAPTVHGKGDHGFVPHLIKIARKKRYSAYVGDGLNRWPAVHRLDAARLFRLALENAAPGTRLHGVAEEGIPMRTIAEAIGAGLGVPVRSITKEQAAAHFSWLAGFVGNDNPVSSSLTRKVMEWQPCEMELLKDLRENGYFS